MLKKIGLILMLVVLSINTQTTWARPIANLYPALKLTDRGNFEGYIDADGKWVVEPVYEMTFDMTDGLGIVTKDNKYGAVDTKGKLVIPMIYDSLSSFNEQRATFVKEGGMGVMDTKGREVTSTLYPYIGSYSEGVALVGKLQGDNYVYGYIDKEGTEVIPPKFKEASDFTDHKALVRTQDDKYTLINQKGETLATYNYDRVYGYSEGMLVYEEATSGKYGYIDEAGNIQVAATYLVAQPFKDGVAVVGESPYYLGQQGLIDKVGKNIYPNSYTNIESLGHNRIALGMAADPEYPERGSCYALADTEGSILTEFIFDGIGTFQEDRASVYNDTVSYFIDKEGRKVEDFPYITGSGILRKVAGNVVQGDIDYERIYLSGEGRILYAPNDVIPLEGGKEVLTETFRLNKDYIVNYPAVRGLADEEVQQSINEKLKEKGVHEDVTAAERAEYTYYSAYSIPYALENLLIVDQVASTYYYGAAHPLPSRGTSVIDLSTGQFYKLEDLFRIDSSWEQHLLSLMNQQTKVPPIKDQIFEDSKLTLDNNYGFLVNEEGLVIYYPPYEIGPYAAGYITFKIPYEQLEDYIDKESAFWMAYH